ncbi:MAG: YhdP family protein [Candidatus Thiodiazotropha sp.]
MSAVKYLHAKFWLVLAWLTILVAIMVTVVRLLLPGIDLEPYRQEIEQVLEKKVGIPLTIGAIQVQLKGARLVLQFTDVNALDKQTDEPLLYAPQVFVEVELLKSLFAGKLQLGGGKVVGTQLKMERNPDGSFSLQGMGGVSNAHPEAVLEILLGNEHLRLSDTEIHLKSAIPGHSPLRLSGVEVDLLNDGLHHQIYVSSRIGTEAQEHVKLVADLHQQTADSMTMSGQFYFKCDDFKLGGRLREWLPEGYQVNQGQVQLEVWGELRQSALHRLSGQTELRDLSISGPLGKAPFELQRLTTNLDWRRQASGWVGGLDQISTSRRSGTWSAEQLELAQWQESAEEVNYHLRADSLSLEGIQDFLSILELPMPGLHDAIIGLSPKGDLRDIDFTLRKSPQKRDEWHLKGLVEGYSSNVWKRIPGLHGVKMAFDGSQSGGWLKIDSNHLVVDYPQLFRDPLKTDHIRGDFLWNFDFTTGLHLQTDYLEMSNPDLQTLSRVEMQIPVSGKDPFVDIQTNFWNADGSRKSDYLPVSVMPDKLVKWLDKSVVGGYVKSGSFLLYGPVSKFPFNGQEGRFEVWFGVEDLVLDYMPDWPHLSEAEGEVHFINNGLQVAVQDGVILNSRLQDISMNIDQLRNSTPLEIRGQAKGPFQDILSVLSDTPLRKNFLPFVKAVSVAGTTRTELDLAIPLKSGRGELKTDGTVNFEKAAMTIKMANQRLDGLSGKLNFSRLGVEATGIRAKVLNQDIRLNVSPITWKGKDWTRIKTSMSIDIDQLKKQFPDWRVDNLFGVGDAELEIRIAHQPRRIPVRVILKSDLQGVRIELPEPLGKVSKEARLLDMGIDFLNDKSIELRVQYGEDSHALLRFIDSIDKSWVAAISFGKEALNLEGIEGVHLSGQISKLNADEWIAWAGSQPLIKQSHLPHIEMDLRIDQLMALGIAFPDARFNYKNFADGYRLNFVSDTVQGNIQVPGDLKNRPILGYFDYIKLNLQDLVSRITGKQSSTEQVEDIDPKILPAVRLSVDNLYINDHPIGKGNLIWSKEDDGITLNKLNLVGDSIDLSGEGYWHLTPKGHSTKLNLQMKTPSLGQLQKELGLSSGIEHAATKVKAEFYWPSSPLEMGAEKLYGSLWLKLGKGQVNNIDPGVGRLIGLFSLNAIGKRLALDFSDLFSKVNGW